MAHQYDRIVHALYLAKSNKREEMLSNLVENLLFSYEFALSFDDIKDLIRDDIGFVPIELELRNCLDNSVSSKQLTSKDDKYDLSDESRKRVSLSLAEENAIETKRYTNFRQQCPSIIDVSLSDEEVQKLWKVYNEYLIKCFLEFGKKATEIFLPNSRINDLRANGFLGDALAQFDSDRLKEGFREIAQEYPDKLIPDEIRYLDSLATRAEKVFSLGLQKEELEKIQNLTFKDVVIFADTNVLYQVLGLSDHAEDEAVQQIVSIARNKSIDIRITCLGRTMKELNTAKEDLERRIPKQNLNPSHIRALLKSPELDNFSRKYYEQKLRDSETPHPSVRVSHAIENLRSKGIEVYRAKFPSLDEDEDNKHLNAQVTEYNDWVTRRNEQRRQVGLNDMRYKSDKQIEHDVYLREAMVLLRKKVRVEHEVKYICLTLDRRLVDFDQYESRQSMAGQFDPVSPLFMAPSVFMSKIRPFLPIQTDDYSKAFVKALTCATADTGDSHRSEMLQRSFSYFLKQGIDDEGAIGNIIKRDLFIHDFEEQENIGQAEDFIKSEVNTEIERVRAAAQEAEKLVAEMKTKVQEANNRTQQETQKYQAEVVQKNDKIAEKDSQITGLEDKVSGMQKQLDNHQAHNALIQRQNKYHRELPEFQNKQWRGFEKNYRKGKWFLVKFTLIHLIPVAIAFILSQGNGIKNWLSSHNFPQEALYWVALIIALIIGAILNVYRTLFIDKQEKELVRSTWNYMWGDRVTIKEEKYQEYKEEFEQKNPDLAESVRSL